MTTKTKTLQSCYVGIDISKELFEICILNEKDETIYRFQIHPDLNGFNLLINQIPNGLNPEFGMEVTGKFANNLVQFLREKDLSVTVTNAFLVARLRDVFSATIKNDETDAWVIAKGLKMGVLKHSLKSKQFQYLQDILEYRHDLVKRKTMVINQLRANLVEIFPEIDQIFSDISCNASLAILEEYPTPDLIMEADMETIRELVLLARGRMGYKKILKLQNLSQNSVASKTGSIHRHIVRSQVKELKQQKQLLKELDSEIKSLSSKFEQELELLQSVPGVGDQTSQYFLAIAGNIERFQHLDDGKGADRLLSFIGFGLREYSSGNSNKIGGISKRGNGKLRGSLFMAAMSAKRVDPDLRTKYEKYVARCGNGKKGLVALARTLVRRMYGVLNSGIPYDPGIPVLHGAVTAA